MVALNGIVPLPGQGAPPQAPGAGLQVNGGPGPQVGDTFSRPIPPPPEKEPEIISPEISDDELLVERLNMVYREYRTCKERVAIETSWGACYRAYRGVKPRRRDPFQDTYVIKEVFRQYHTLMPQILKLFFSSPQLFRYNPQHAGAEEKMLAAERIAHWQIYKYGIDQQLKDFLRTAVLFGTSYLTYGWQTFKKNWMRPCALHDVKTGKFWGRKTDEIYESRPYVDFIPPNEIFSHPRVADPRNSPFTFRIQIVSGSDLKRMAREGDLDADVVEECCDDRSGAPFESLQDMYRLSGYDSDTLTLDSLPDEDVPHELMTCWSTANRCWDYGVIDQRYLARGREVDSGEIPLLCARNYPQIEQHWGIPEPEVIIEDQRMLNEIATQWMDAIHYRGPFFKATDQAMKRLGNFHARVGAKMNCGDNLNDIEIMNTPPIEESYGEAMDRTTRNMQRMSGVTDESAGMGTNASTARMGIELKQAADLRTNDKADGFATPMREAFTKIYILNRENLDKAWSFKVEGKDGAPIYVDANPDQFDEYDCDCQLADVTESNMELAAKWQNYYQIAGQDPLVNRKRILTKWGRALGEPRPDSLLSNGQQAMTSALDENAYWQAFGIVDAPDPSDDHQTHLQVHGMLTQSVEFASLHPIKQATILRHIQQHQDYANFSQKQQQAMDTQMQKAHIFGMQKKVAARVSPAMADQQTEAFFQNGQIGAGQNGQAQQPNPNPGGMGQ